MDNKWLKLRERARGWVPGQVALDPKEFIGLIDELEALRGALGLIQSQANGREMKSFGFYRGVHVVITDRELEQINALLALPATKEGGKQ